MTKSVIQRDNLNRRSPLFNSPNAPFALFLHNDHRDPFADICLSVLDRFALFQILLNLVQKIGNFLDSFMNLRRGFALESQVANQ